MAAGSDSGVMKSYVRELMEERKRLMEQKRLELTGKCVSCFSPNGVLISYGGGHDYLCARCAQALDLREQAEKHLVDYLPVALIPWKEHWLARGLAA